VKALLFLDIDGVLNPWAAPVCPPGYAEHRWRRRKAWLSPAHGPALRELTGVELVWASSWGEDANALVGKALGLPPLPVVTFAGPHADTGPDWKFTAVRRFAYGRPLAWFDDDFELRAGARERFLARRDQPTLLVPVDPAAGLTAAHVDAVTHWQG
jgi:Swiss Army Knife RNA repair-like protein